MKQLALPHWLQPTAEWVRILFEYMSPREKALLAVLTIVLLASTVLSARGYIQRNSHLIPEAGGTYTEGAVGQPRHINPILAGANDLDMDITSLVYSPLFKLDDELSLQADLATSYEISSNQLTYTIQLRQDVTWHDGQPFTADDVVFTVRSIQTPEYGSPLEASFQGVQVDKVDDYTVEFTLKQPYAPFLNNLTVGIAPKHIWENIPPKNAALAEQILKPVGTGPFKFAEIVTRRKTGEITSFKLVRNREYHGQQPYLDEFVFLFFPTNEEATRALLANKVDGIGFLPLSAANDIRSRSSLTIRQLLLPQYFSLFFNEIKNEALGDAAVRSALLLATDREEIIATALQDEAYPLHVPIPYGVFRLVDAASPFDPEEAKHKLEEAGWKDANGNGVREKDGTQLQVTITTTDWPEFVRTAQIIQKQWEAIGIEVELENYGAGVIQQAVVGPREYEILLYGQILSTNPDPYPFWHSTQTRSPGLNLSLIKDESIDKALEEARKIHDKAEREKRYLEFQERFLELNPAIVLYQPHYLFAHNNNVGGHTMRNVNLPHGRFNDIEEWHVRTKRVWND